MPGNYPLPAYLDQSTETAQAYLRSYQMGANLSMEKQAQEHQMEMEKARSEREMQRMALDKAFNDQELQLKQKAFDLHAKDLTEKFKAQEDFKARMQADPNADPLKTAFQTGYRPTAGEAAAFRREKEQAPAKVSYETPFPDMPWIKIAKTDKGGIHIIKGDAPMTATQRASALQTIKSLSVAPLKESPADRDFRLSQIQILRDALALKQGGANVQAPPGWLKTQGGDWLKPDLQGIAPSAPDSQSTPSGSDTPPDTRSDTDISMDDFQKWRSGK